MQLTLFSDLSLRVITLMAMGELGRKYTAAEVAESLNASRAHVSKVVSRLVELGFLEAVKGRNGGIYLRDSATEKSVGKLLRTLENNEVVDCVGTDCPLLPTCLLRGKLAAAQEAFFAALDPVLIADLIPPKSANGVDANRPEGGGPQGSTQLNIRPV
ncbi:Rrf2 family transcriptional regulator [Corynebacterium sp. ACRPX]|uniref:RrF2 family transcriptional regulator n=1 Tax=unclassified Corynebacterium TaxID=2624378 RepID=UPI0008A5849F|nr:MULTISPECIES: Rrf2 family transcriptional regulator [unclassified Corynebacterium]MCG7245944.1 Rrf2 family transcriptional regulator [Corynebacterium sp. ACRPX]OFR93632.1 transcriptional regulator, BadM/Rrf2 family protein [Corynebacterium sp. HMSC064E10]